MIVLDASAAMSIVTPSQATTASTEFAANNVEPWIAPAVFIYEIRHALLRLERRLRLNPDSVDTQIEEITAEMELIEDDPSADILANTMALARDGGVSFYDACYVELALREGAALASRDGKQLALAEAKGVAIFDLR
jgi:predicted nucleic acid-binding protein